MVRMNTPLFSSTSTAVKHRDPRPRPDKFTKLTKDKHTAPMPLQQVKPRPPVSLASPTGLPLAPHTLEVRYLHPHPSNSNVPRSKHNLINVQWPCDRLSDCERRKMDRNGWFGE